MNRYFFFFCALVLMLSNNLIGQQRFKIEGFVKDTTNKSIQFASVIIKDNVSGKIKLFTNTDTNGFYQLTLLNSDSLSYQLVVQSLGFGKYYFEFKTSSEPILRHNIVLKSQNTILNEVVVSSKNSGVSEKKDTTEYLVKKFIETQNENVEAILKKLPFIDVSENGEIRFKGKKVERILIDGDDLFDNKYTIGTRSLKANILDKVQAIEHYSENKLLKGIEHSDKIALNLVVKEENKKAVTGSIEATSDFGNRVLGTLNGISYIKNFKGFFVGNINNIGNDPANISTLVKPENNSTSLFTNTITSYIQPNTIPILNVKNERVIDGDLRMGAFNFVNQWSKQLKSKGFFYGYNHKGVSQINNEESYTLPNESFQISESRISSQLLQNKTFQHELLFTPNDKIGIKHVSYLSYDSFQNDFHSNITNEKVFFLKELLQSPLRTFGQMFQFTTRLNPNQAFLAEAKFQRRKQQQAYIVPFNSVFQQFFNISRNFYEITQFVENSNDEVSLKTRLMGINAHGDNYFIEGGFCKQTVLLNTVLTLSDTSSLIVLPEPYKNQQKTLQSQYFINSNFHRVIHKTDISLGLNTSLFHQTLSIEKEIRSYEQLFFSPSILLLRKFDASNLLFSYKYYPKGSDISNIYTQNILTNYRVFQSGIGQITRWGNHLLLVNYTNFNLYNNLKYSISSILTFQENTIINNSQISQTLTSSSMLLSNKGTLLYNFSGNVEKYIPNFLLNIKSKIYFSNSNMLSQLNGIDRSLISQNKTFQIELLSAFDGIINIDLSGQYSVDKLSIVSSLYNLEQINKTLSFYERVKFKISPSLKGYIRGEQYMVNNEKTTNTNQIYDFQLNYTPHKSKISFSLDIKNLLNTNNYLIRSVSDYSVNQTQYNLLPRWILLGLGYQF